MLPILAQGTVCTAEISVLNVKLFLLRLDFYFIYLFFKWVFSWASSGHLVVQTCSLTIVVLFHVSYWYNWNKPLNSVSSMLGSWSLKKIKNKTRPHLPNFTVFTQQLACPNECTEWKNVKTSTLVLPVAEKKYIRDSLISWCTKCGFPGHRFLHSSRLKKHFQCKTATDIYIYYKTSLNQEFCHLVSTWYGYYLLIVNVFIKWLCKWKHLWSKNII